MSLVLRMFGSRRPVHQSCARERETPSHVASCWYVQRLDDRFSLSLIATGDDTLNISHVPGDPASNQILRMELDRVAFNS